MFPQSYTQTLEAFEAVHGRPPIYFDVQNMGDDVPMGNLLAALLVDGYEALSVLGVPARETFELLAGTGFDFDRLVCDQYRRKLSLQALQDLHGLGRKTLRDILRRNGIPVGLRRERADVSDEQLLKAYANSGMYTVVARQFEMHRTTVASRLRPVLAGTFDTPRRY